MEGTRRKVYSDFIIALHLGHSLGRGRWGASWVNFSISIVLQTEPLNGVYPRVKKTKDKNPNERTLLSGFSNPMALRSLKLAKLHLLFA